MAGPAPRATQHNQVQFERTQQAGCQGLVVTVLTSAMALILSVTLLDSTTTFSLLRTLLTRRAQSSTRSSGLGDIISASAAELRGPNNAIIGLKEPELISISSSMRCAEGVAGGVGATGNMSAELWTWIHQLSLAMHSSIHCRMEVAFVDRLNMPSRCFMESNSLITVKRNVCTASVTKTFGDVSRAFQDEFAQHLHNSCICSELTNPWYEQASSF